jgi:hypothetical protein
MTPYRPPTSFPPSRHLRSRLMTSFLSPWVHGSVIAAHWRLWIHIWFFHFRTQFIDLAMHFWDSRLRLGFLRALPSLSASPPMREQPHDRPGVTDHENNLSSGIHTEYAHDWLVPCPYYISFVPNKTNRRHIVIRLVITTFDRNYGARSFLLWLHSYAKSLRYGKTGRCFKKAVIWCGTISKRIIFSHLHDWEKFEGNWEILAAIFCGCLSFVFLVGGLMRLKIRAFAGAFHALFHGQKGGSLLRCCFCFQCFTCCVFSSSGCNYRLITPLILLMVDTSQECG